MKNLMDAPEVRRRKRQAALGKAIRECNGNYKSVAEKFGIEESAVRKIYEGIV